MTRPLWTAAIMALVACAAAWSMLQIDWAPPRPTVACGDVFADEPTLEVPDDPNASYVVRATLQSERPPAVVQYQIIDANGFGWVLRDLPADGRTEHVVQLPRVAATHTIRTVLLAPEEAARAETTRRAARSLNVRTWWASRGWLDPATSVCTALEVNR